MLVGWIHFFQGSRNLVDHFQYLFDICSLMAIGGFVGALMQIGRWSGYLPRYAAWGIVGAVLPATFLRFDFPSSLTDWTDPRGYYAFVPNLFGGMLGMALGLSTRPGGHWYQLSLRTMLLLVTVMAILLSPLGRMAVRGRLQRATVQALSQKGGGVTYTADDRPLSSFWKSLFGRDAVDRIVVVNWHGQRPVRIGKVTTHFGASGTARDEDLLLLEGMHDLETLYLQGSAISDQGLETLSRLRKLRELDLRGAPISDEGTHIFQNFPSLRRLDLRGTELSPQAVRDLRASLPECEIFFE